MIRLRPFLVTLALFAAPSVLWLGLWSPTPVGIDAVCAVTPGHVAVVGAIAPAAAGAPAPAKTVDLVRRVGFMSGGLHRAIEPTAAWILLRPGHAAGDDRALDRHLEVVRAVVAQLHDLAPQARIALLVGGVPGSGVAAPPHLAAGLAALSADPALAGVPVEVLDLAAAEVEEVEVPDGGLAANLYPVPVVLLEADAVVNVARGGGPLGALRNLEGLAGAAPQTGPYRLVDLALLCEVDYTVLDLLDGEAPGAPLLLASRDGIAVDRVALAIAGGDSAAQATLAAASARHLGQARLADIKVTEIDVPGTWVPAPDTTIAPGRS